METGELTSEGFGDGTKLYQQRARRALPILIAQAKAGEPLFYRDLAFQLNMPNPRNLNYVLGAVGGELTRLSRTWGSPIPPLTCIVINQQDQLPGRGIGWFIEDASDFKKKPLQERRRVVGIILNDIYTFPSWNRVLEHFGIDAAQPITQTEMNSASREAFRRYGASVGEGDLHRKLKEYIANHPEIIGIPKNSKAEVEHLFPSADRIDILFHNDQEVIGVEIKGPISDDIDLLRGLFQCVKYRALLEADRNCCSLPKAPEVS